MVVVAPNAMIAAAKRANRTLQVGQVERDADVAVLEGLFTTVTNVNFDAKRIAELVKKSVVRTEGQFIAQGLCRLSLEPHHFAKERQVSAEVIVRPHLPPRLLAPRYCPRHRFDQVLRQRGRPHPLLLHQAQVRLLPRGESCRFFGGRSEKVGALELYFFADAKDYLPPTGYMLECKTADNWHEFVSQQRDPAAPLANGRNRVTFPAAQCSALRVNLQGPAAPAKLRLIELKAFTE